MIKRQFLVFLIRWLLSSFGIFLCISWFARISSYAWIYYFIAGLVFSLVNSFVKPLAKMLILPLAIFTMGISTLFINLGMVWIALSVLPSVNMELWGIISTSLILSLINSLVNLAIPSYNK